jgi:hypothetical protein
MDFREFSLIQRKIPKNGELGLKLKKIRNFLTIEWE